MGVHDGLNKMGTGPGMIRNKYKGILYFDETKRKKPEWNGFDNTVYITGWYVIHQGNEIPLYYKDANYAEMHKYMNGDYVFNGREVEYTIDSWCEMGLGLGQEQYSGIFQMKYGTAAKLVDGKSYETELEKCINSPYHFVVNYLTINGERFTTNLSEDEFNNKFNQIISQLK